LGDAATGRAVPVHPEAMMIILRRVAATLAVLGSVAVAPGAATAAAGQDALARVYDENSRVLAEAYFESTGDSFAVTRRAGAGERPYVEYRYVRKDGTLREGTHWGSGTVGETVRFDHNFGEGRTVTFRVCMRAGHGPDACSGTEFGENWTVGTA
jgi:hypothetical protein